MQPPNPSKGVFRYLTKLLDNYESPKTLPEIPKILNQSTKY